MRGTNKCAFFRNLMYPRSAGSVCLNQGTGKSFVGVEIVRALLANKRDVTSRPILIVCYTNHALDQFLESLLNCKVENMIRLGGRSKIEAIQEKSLFNANRTKTPCQKREEWQCYKEIDILKEELEVLNTKVSAQNMTWEDFEPFIESENFAVYCSFLEKQEELLNANSDGWKTVYRDEPKDVLDYWRSGSDIRLKQNASKYHKRRTLQQLLELNNTWETSKDERKTLFDYWNREYLKQEFTEYASISSRLEKVCVRLNGTQDAIQVELLTQQDIIGVTTTGAGKYRNLLAAVGPKIVICEEAGEVLESHILSTLNSNVQQLVLIGDHEQLRPKVANYSLSQESQDGIKYRLDLSLFERLREPFYKFPLKTRETDVIRAIG
jgi:AAA domain